MSSLNRRRELAGRQIPQSNQVAKFLVAQNLRLAKSLASYTPSPLARRTLRMLSIELGLSIEAGDLRYLENGWYVSHSGLLRLARRNRCVGIETGPIKEFCDPASGRWVFRAIVYKSRGSKTFIGYGDADPFNVSPLVHGAEMRVAETRAVNRALRKAYGIGLCSVEELGWIPRQPDPERATTPSSVASRNGQHSTQPRLRDRLCLLIRQHHLDAALVKAYAADYCGVPAVRDASRESIEAFINHLTEKTVHDFEGLLCQLNSYAKAQEAHP